MWSDGKSKTLGIDASIDARARTGLVCLGEEKPADPEELAENAGRKHRYGGAASLGVCSMSCMFSFLACMIRRQKAKPGQPWCERRLCGTQS